MADLDGKLDRLANLLRDYQAGIQRSIEATSTVKTDEIVLELVMETLLEMRQEQLALQRAVASYMISGSEDARKRRFDSVEDYVQVYHKANIPINARFIFKMTERGAEIHVEIADPGEPTSWDKIKNA